MLIFADPSAKQWWSSHFPAFSGNQLTGIWSDLGEPEAHPETMNHFLETRDKIHNIFNFLWSQLLFEGINQIRPNKRVFNLTRSAFAGSQRYGIIPWSGDVAKEFGGLKVQLPMLLNMGICQNFPNPFNPTTKIKYTIPNVISSGTKQSQLVTLKVYDILGNEIETLVNEEKPAGSYEVEFSVGQDSSPDNASGVYFYRLQAGTFVETKKMILLK